MAQIGDAEKLIAVIGDEDTVTGFLLAGAGDNTGREGSNYFVADKNTKTTELEEVFTRFTERKDIGIIMINQSQADEIRHLINAYKGTVPTILEIPTKDKPYDPSKDTIVRRVTLMLGGEQ
ncbi:hypothetical protein WA158_000593 [Blastocystis sp. Blastoise]